jgi:dethiobiotin synthetase
MRPVFFITGIGTGVGKTLVSAILTEALDADYWKPIQAGYADGTDALQVSQWLSNPDKKIQQELYKLKLPASPHIAAREEGISISLENIKTAFDRLCLASNRPLIIEGAGGLMVPLNESQTLLDLIKIMEAPVIVVSRNYLGSINHSLLTANALKQTGAKLAGWVFNDQFMQYEAEISHWTEMPILGSIPFTDTPDKDFVRQQAGLIAPGLKKLV